MLLVDAVLREETVNSDAYIRTLTDLRKCFIWVWPHKNMAENFLQLGNARFTHKLEDSGIHYKIWWELLPHPPYSTDLAPSDFHQFRALKDAIYDTKFRDMMM